MDAVDGPVVLVTKPLHAFEAEKGKKKPLVTVKLRTGHQERMACGQVAQGQVELGSHLEVTRHRGVPYMGNKAGPRVSG